MQTEVQEFDRIERETVVCVCVCARAQAHVCVCDEGHALFIADISMRSDLQNKISRLCGKQLRMAKVSTSHNPQGCIVHYINIQRHKDMHRHICDTYQSF